MEMSFTIGHSITLFKTKLKVSNTIAITGAIRGTSKEVLYEELDLESL